RRVVRPIDRLVQITRTMPARVAAGESVQWFESPVTETDFLISNLKVMADSLKNKFIENRQINESLEQRIAGRTEKLRESEAFLDSIIENIPAMVFVKDASSLRFVKLNRAGEKLLGYSEKELTGKSDYDFFPKAEADFFVQKDRQALAGGRLVEIAEETVLTRHLGERILHTKKIPVLDRRGIPRYLLGISEDITESKQDRKALEDANLRLRKSHTATLNILEDLKAENEARKKNEAERDKLQAQLIQAQKMESVGRLAGGVAHDFNNMLNVILGYTELALQGMPPTDPLYEDLKEILSAARRSSDITRQLLAFARKQTIAPVALDLNETVEGMLKMLRRLIGEDIDLVWKPGTGLWPVNMDPAQVDQILANLLVNARDAISGVGKVTIETENVALDEHYCADRPDFVPGEYVLLAVSDDGCGMDRKTMDHLFEPFFTTKGVGEGTGLGLATVYGIVRQNSGFINVYSEPGQGATFKIYLPRHAGEAAAEQLFTGIETLYGTGESVLVVEDEPSVLKLANKMLAGMGYTVLATPGPKAALELAQRHTGPIDLLITDVVMPEMSGRELAEKLETVHPGLRVLYMSGYTANVIAHRGILDEGVRFIQKPFNKRDLARKVREALEK
ncbi:MAG: PAS domain S-box protein, partial [Thermodesulfobacteriota bacterium]